MRPLCRRNPIRLCRRRIGFTWSDPARFVAGSSNEEGGRPKIPATTPQNYQVLDQFLDPIRDILTPEVAQAIADLRASPAIQDRIEDFASRHHEGKLSPEELAEYEALVGGANLVAVLQAKARTVVVRKPSR